MCKNCKFSRFAIFILFFLFFSFYKSHAWIEYTYRIHIRDLLSQKDISVARLSKLLFKSSDSSRGRARVRVRVGQIADAGSTSAVLLGSRWGDVRVRPSALEEWCIVDWWGILLSRNFRRCTVTDALLCSSCTHPWERLRDASTCDEGIAKRARVCDRACTCPVCVVYVCACVCGGSCSPPLLRSHAYTGEVPSALIPREISRCSFDATLIGTFSPARRDIQTACGDTSWEARSRNMAQPTSSALRALALEYKSLQEEPVEGFRVKLVNEDNMFEWEVAIFGPPDTLYQGGYFKVLLFTCLAYLCIDDVCVWLCIYAMTDIGVSNYVRDIVLGYVGDHPSRSFPFLSSVMKYMYTYIKSSILAMHRKLYRSVCLLSEKERKDSILYREKHVNKETRAGWSFKNVTWRCLILVFIKRKYNVSIRFYLVCDVAWYYWPSFRFASNFIRCWIKFIHVEMMTLMCDTYC